MKIFQFLRSLLVLLFVPPFTIFVSVVALTAMALFRVRPTAAQCIPRFWGKTITWLAGTTVQVKGLEQLDRSKPYIFAANHQSQFDIFALQGHFDFDFRWLAKQELFDVPFFGRAMRMSGYIPVERSKGRKAMKSLLEAANRIAEGTSVVIFPEGTRSTDGLLQEFKAGPIMLAVKSGVPIVPVAIQGTHEIMPKGKLLPRPGAIVITVGAPIPTAAYDVKRKKELADHLQQELAALLGQPPPAAQTSGDDTIDPQHAGG